jgi:ApaG protein
MQHKFCFTEQKGMSTYTATTEGITVTAHPVYLDGQSDIINRKFVFAYFIRIANNSDELVQLLRRHWIISDSGGELKQVEGEGVVGKQPLIPPGKSHDYNSFCVLETFEGTMEGTYLMRRENGDEFKVLIPRFVLRAAAN